MTRGTETNEPNFAKWQPKKRRRSQQHTSGHCRVLKRPFTMAVDVSIAAGVPVRSVRRVLLSREPCLNQVSPSIAAVLLINLLTLGCASSYEPRPDLDTVETIGVVLPEGSNEPLVADDVVQLHNRTAVEDRVKNSAIGAGSGAAVGTAVGIGAAALTGCALTGPLAPLCWIVFAGGGAVLGGGAGAVARATVDTQQRVEVAPVHLYEVDEVLPALQQRYLAGPDLEKRTLRLVHEINPEIRFLPAKPVGTRFRLVMDNGTEGAYSDVNLVLSDLRVELVGKAKDDPNLALTAHTKWVLSKHDSSGATAGVWDVLSGDYRSERRRLSEWLKDDGSLLNGEVDRALEESLTKAFSLLHR